jgi:hypothetical protein
VRSPTEPKLSASVFVFITDAINGSDTSPLAKTFLAWREWLIKHYPDEAERLATLQRIGTRAPDADEKRELARIDDGVYVVLGSIEQCQRYSKYVAEAAKITKLLMLHEITKTGCRYFNTASVQHLTKDQLFLERAYSRGATKLAKETKVRVGASNKLVQQLLELATKAQTPDPQAAGASATTTTTTTTGATAAAATTARTPAVDREAPTRRLAGSNAAAGPPAGVEAIHGHNGDGKCYVCGQTGHAWAKCPDPRRKWIHGFTKKGVLYRTTPLK